MDRVEQLQDALKGIPINTYIRIEYAWINRRTGQVADSLSALHAVVRPEDWEVKSRVVADISGPWQG